MGEPRNENVFNVVVPFATREEAFAFAKSLNTEVLIANLYKKLLVERVIPGSRMVAMSSCPFTEQQYAHLYQVLFTSM